jgi:hypothetical protein
MSIYFTIRKSNQVIFRFDTLSFCSKPSVISFDARSQEAVFLPLPFTTHGHTVFHLGNALMIDWKWLKKS